MKRPLKPSEVPPGSVFRFKLGDKTGWAAPFQVSYDGVFFTWTTSTRRIPWDKLADEYEILRPGEDWQECAVDEVNPADYKTGTIVDYPTARKLHNLGVKLEIRSTYHEKWTPAGETVWYTDDELSGWRASFRVAIPAPKLRDIRPDELPERFEVVWPDGWGKVFDSCYMNPKAIQRRIEEGAKWRTDLNAKELNSFLVEDK